MTNKEIREMIQELKSFAYSGFLEPDKSDLLKYAKTIEYLQNEIERLKRVDKYNQP